jgi:hypothetical protein
LRVTAVVSLLLGALLLLGSWDWLWDKLDLPQGLPALTTQMGGVAVLALAFLLWSAAANPELLRPVGIAGVLFYLGSAVLLASWLIFRDKPDLEVGDRGWTILIIAAIVFAGLGASLVRASRS